MANNDLSFRGRRFASRHLATFLAGPLAYLLASSLASFFVYFLPDLSSFHLQPLYSNFFLSSLPFPSFMSCMENLSQQFYFLCLPDYFILCFTFTPPRACIIPSIVLFLSMPCFTDRRALFQTRFVASKISSVNEEKELLVLCINSLQLPTQYYSILSY